MGVAYNNNNKKRVTVKREKREKNEFAVFGKIKIIITFKSCATDFNSFPLIIFFSDLFLSERRFEM